MCSSDLMRRRRSDLDEARAALERQLVHIREVLADIARRHRLEAVMDSRFFFYGAVDLTSELLLSLGATSSASASGEILSLPADRPVEGPPSAMPSR